MHASSKKSSRRGARFCLRNVGCVVGNCSKSLQYSPYYHVFQTGVSFSIGRLADISNVYRSIGRPDEKGRVIGCDTRPTR
jgi:hypothetical protein